MTTIPAPTTEDLYAEANTAAFPFSTIYLQEDWLTETAHNHLVEDIEEQCRNFYHFTWDTEAGTITHLTMGHARLKELADQLFDDHRPTDYVQDVRDAFYSGAFDDDEYVTA